MIRDVSIVLRILVADCLLSLLVGNGDLVTSS